MLKLPLIPNVSLYTTWLRSHLIQNITNKKIHIHSQRLSLTRTLPKEIAFSFLFCCYYLYCYYTTLFRILNVKISQNLNEHEASRSLLNNTPHTQYVPLYTVGFQRYNSYDIECESVALLTTLTLYVSHTQPYYDQLLRYFSVSAMVLYGETEQSEFVALLFHKNGVLPLNAKTHLTA